MKVETLYKQRFNKNELHRKNAIWKILCKNFFQKYISKNSSVLDIGAGYCEFINNIQCCISEKSISKTYEIIEKINEFNELNSNSIL